MTRKDSLLEAGTDVAAASLAHALRDRAVATLLEAKNDIEKAGQAHALLVEARAVERVREHIVHVIDEQRSPGSVWTMWCGAHCIVLASGEIAPGDMDVLLEARAELATCGVCRIKLKTHKEER